MKYLKISPFFLSLLFIFGCSRDSKHIFIADQLTKQTADQLKKEKGLSLIAIGGGMMGDIQAMGADFAYFNLVNLQEARKLIVYASQCYLKNINSNKKIRPYLHNYPFDIKNISVLIVINHPETLSLEKKNICCISIVKGIISYNLESPTRYAPMPLLKEETYEEALKIVEKKQR